MTDCVRQSLLGIGQFAGFLQLQGFVGGLGFLFCRIFLLWLLMIACKEGEQEYDILHLVRFITGYRGWLTGKCLSSSFRKSWPNLVFRAMLNGGLYQIMFFLLLLFFFWFWFSGWLLGVGVWLDWDAVTGVVLGSVCMWSAVFVVTVCSVVIVIVWLDVCERFSRKRLDLLGCVGVLLFLLF